ncbi:MAG TPA: hypothetical protein VNU66_11375 [Mycobacteriales bacterium]|nr:hypothetical protein [Mycobacteriales bacterium]
MRPAPVLAALAATALVAVAAGPVTASTPAATAAVPAAGTATSSVVLAELVAAGTGVTVGAVQLVTDTTGAAPVARVIVTPLRSGDTVVGAREVGPGDGASTVGAQSLSLAGLGAVSSPALQVAAQTPVTGPTASAGAASLGGLTLLGLPVALDGTVSAASSVLAGGATSGKTVEVRDLSLPGVGALLARLGLDLDALGALVPGVLAQLVDRLGLPVDSAELLAQVQAVADAQTAVDTARGAVATAEAGVTTATSDLAAATGVLAAETAELELLKGVQATAQATLDAAVAAAAGPACDLLPGNLLCAAVDRARAALAEATAAVDAQQLVVDAAQAAVTTAQSALTAAQGVLAAAVAALDGLLAQLASLLQSLPGLVAELTAVLDAVPLLELELLSVTSRAAATSAAAGGQDAGVSGGELQGLRVLGTDVLALPQVRTALGLAPGAAGVDVAGLAGARLAAVQAAVDGLLATLTDLLDGAVPGLVVPALEVGLLERTTTTAVADGFGTASAALGGLRVAVPALSIPTSLLPSVSLSSSAGGVRAAAVTSPVELVLGAVTETARFRPAATAQVPGGEVPGGPVPGAGTPGTGTPVATPVTSGSPLPRTGPQALVALAGLGALMGAALLRRWLLERA